jgi:hypothetical protein
MSGIRIHGIGAVSPAGWGLGALRQALEAGKPLPVQELARPGWTRALAVRRVPPPETKPAFFSHPRLRRSSPISQYAVAAALEALGPAAAPVAAGEWKLGVILCVMSGCVNYSRRFYDEVLRDPATASPLVFPETVFNAPSSHLAALLGTTAINYTLVGDPGSFLMGLVVAGDWFAQKLVEGCVIVAAEESDWLTADAFRLFTRDLVIAEGAGALYVRPGGTGMGVELGAVSDALLFTNQAERRKAIAQAAAEAREHGANGLLCDGTQGLPVLDRAEVEGWADWTGPRISPGRILGQGLMASAAWQCVSGIDRIARGMHSRAVVHTPGINEHVMWASFDRCA